MRIKQLAYAIGMIGFVGSAGMAHAADEVQKAEKIEITGSSIKRIAKEGALPVQVVTRDDIARTGATSTEQLLQNLTAVSTSGAIQGATGAGSSTYGLSSVSLRGLESDRTLVLVNGRRVAAFAGGGGATVNVNAIPLAAIERIEVLKDGASGVYGSDAIAGVVNFILTKNYQGLEIEGQTGQPTRSGGGDTNKVALVGGFGDINENGFNITLSASYEKEKTLKAADREFAKSGNRFPYFVNGATGQGNIEGVFTESTGVGSAGTQHPTLWGTSPGTGYGNPLAGSNNCEAQQMFLAGNTSKGGKYCAFDSAPFVGLIPDRELLNFSGNFTLKLTENAELFADALYSKSIVKQAYQANPIRESFLETDSLFAEQGVSNALLFRPTNPNYQIAADYLNSIGAGALVGQTLAVTSRTLGFGGRANKDTAEQTRFVAGVRGLIADQDYELAYSKNESKTDGVVTDGYFSQVKYVKIINDANNWNPWAADGLGNDALKAALKEAAYTGGTLKAKSSSDVVDGKLSGELFAFGDSSVMYAAGGQWRKEEYVTNPSPALETGDIAGLGGSVPPVNRDRKVTAAFGEVIIPVTKQIEGGLAIRHDRYNDVGNSTNYKASLRWQPVPSFLARVSAGTGFRAPTLTDLWQPQSTGSSEQFDDPLTGLKDLQVTSLTGGNPKLKPEESQQWSLGVVFAPNGSFSAAVDLFSIQIDDIIATPSAQEVVSGFRAGNSAYLDKVTVTQTGDISGITQTIGNYGRAKVRGVDLDMNYARNFFFGKMKFALAGTYMTKFDQTSPGGEVSHKVGTTVNADGTPVLGADGGGVILRWKHSLSANWSRGGWGAGVTQNFYKGYRDSDDLLGNPHYVPSQSTFDLNASYTGIKGLKLGLGVKNVLDDEPPVYIPVSNQFQYGYDISQYDPRARFVYLTAGYKFW
ncbi:TonB-dependent receptor [Chitinimonas taiwanensis]|uniref:Iron complex outermembrane recepter protein n=1 Tax=Chitinimonas taiwanensis DSM 18899 TaxID=1121279 RepID=A0A1K2HIS1_9NEIS|nr:TonB-dependent receptor [Chitinimonas taiwanensis]SFZ76752.1 iron complex outermembrane recepter protein [Chitinimonas taiwanensis DSM 18899]